MRQERNIALAVMATILAVIMGMCAFGCAPVLKTWEAGHPLAGQHISETGNCHTEYTSEGCEIEWCGFAGGGEDSTGISYMVYPDSGSTPDTSTNDI